MNDDVDNGENVFGQLVVKEPEDGPNEAGDAGFVEKGEVGVAVFGLKATGDFGFGSFNGS